MKKVLALILALTIAMSFAACTGGEKTPDDVSTPDTTTPDAATPDVSTPDADAAAAVAEYVELSKSALPADQLETDVFKMDIVAEGTKVVYKYTYKDVQGASAADLKAALDAAYEEQKATLDGIMAQMKKEEPAITSISYCYYMPDNTLIVEYEYQQQA